MSTVKSFSVGNGDMYYINHNSDNFTVIDCCISSDQKHEILSEIQPRFNSKQIGRFISTHADDDHIRGLKLLDEQLDIRNFYCVENQTTKSDETDDFLHYCALRDSSKTFHIHADCSRKWMNLSDHERSTSGVSVLWPKKDDEHFLEAIKISNAGESPNNISPILRYDVENGASFMWMGDLETDFMEKIYYSVTLPQTDIVFAPHHGRSSGKIPAAMLKEINPKLIVIGEAPSRFLDYYYGYNTITQNSAGHIEFEIDTNKVHVFTSNSGYRANYLSRELSYLPNPYYTGTLST